MDPGLFQLQMKQNSEDLQDYIKGLDNWEEDMKKRDKLLKKQKPILKKTLPPVRGQLKPATKKSETKINNDDSNKANRIKSFDYTAWNKFDVDAACEDTPSSASSEEEDDVDEKETQEEDRRKQTAELEKERGNQLFKEGKYQAAVERYTKAMDLNPTSHILPANRAMARIKMKQYSDAESDCNLSIALEEDYIKSWQRRATARTKLGKLQDALDDFKQVLKMEPSSRATMQEIKKLEEQIAKQPKKSAKQLLAETRDPKVVLPVARSPDKRSKKPLVRIDIEEVGGILSDPLIKDIEENKDKLKENCSVTGDKSSATVAENPKPKNILSLPYVPTTSIEFMSHWKSLKGNQELLVKYFQSIPLCNYPTLLNQSLETSVFTDILDILQDHYTGVSLADVLEWLTKVSRFSVAIMFLSKADKQKLTDIFQSLKSSNTLQQESLTKLAKQYSIKL